MRYIESAYDIAHAAGWDAGNESMEKAGRTTWNEEDQREAVRVFNSVIENEEKEEQSYANTH